MYLEYTLNRLNVYHANQGQIWGEKQGGFEIMWGWVWATMGLGWGNH